MHYHSPPGIGPRQCTHCHQILIAPLWRLIEPGEYEPSCQPCAAAQDAAFTPEQAVLHAIVIVGMWQGATMKARAL